MIETKLNIQVVNSAIKLGGMGEIISDKFRKGRCDMLIKMPAAPIAFIEGKLYKCKHPPESVPVDTTVHQKEYLHFKRKHGLIACVLVYVAVDKNPPVCYPVLDLDAERFDTGLVRHFRREVYHTWPIDEIMDYVYTEEMKWREKTT